MTNSISSATPERRDASENRQRILAAAIKLFDQNGVEKTSMKQIAIAAGVGTGTLYRRYKNKSDLSLALIKDNIQQLFLDIDQYLVSSQSRQPEQRLRVVLKRFIDFREKKAQLLNGVEGTPKINSLADKLNGPIFGRLHNVFVSLLDEIGYQDAVPDSLFRADLLVTALSHDYYIFQRTVRQKSPEQILNQIYSLVAPNQPEVND